MAELPILPLKTDALLADTSHMSAEEFGVYCRLLFTMWRHGGKLPDDTEALRRAGGVTLKRWNAIASRVMAPMTVAEGVIFQKRLSSTWLEVQELRKKRATAANRRWASKSNASASSPGMQVDAFCNANQIRKKETTSLPSAAREESTVDNPAVGPATAPLGSAPSRPPGTTNGEAKGQPRKEVEASKLPPGTPVTQAEYMARVGNK